MAAYAAMTTLRTRRSAKTASTEDMLIYLVRSDVLVDANIAGKRVLETISAPAEPLGKLKAYLATHFDSFVQIFDEPLQPGVRVFSSLDQKSKLIVETSDNSMRLQLTSSDFTSEGEDIHSLRALKSELSTLRANARAAPFLLWRQTSDGRLTWVNQSYLDAVKAILGADTQTDWPLPNLFPSLKMASGKTSRILLKNQDGTDAWYDCHVTPVGRDYLCTAFKADEAVRSENRRREFTQTLTKTFAELAIGLAIFDRSRNLVLFNPALLDLTSLPTDFLASRPSMVNFLDRLRENRVMPEPRDYRTWRNSIAELEAAAQDGTYSETWSLPDGHTYHVTGRPHPDGAVALLFEDISAEMSLTRRFRAELEQSQSVIDALEDGVAMFSAAGQLILTNKAYCDLWGTNDQSFLTGADVSDVTRAWHEVASPTPVWGDFRDFTRRTHDREEWQASVSLKDGRSVLCRFLPQKGGGTLAVFRLMSSSGVVKEDLQKAV
ncbi:MAG: PAS domain-containing protein [Silicimonas sp.]|nr:PAS domain-containing protein [Silicimonas sp.]